MLFISHSTLDKEHTIDLQRRLRERGYACDQHFLDSDQRSGIKLGEKWEKVIYDNLRDCRALLVLCSPNWLQSKWCFAELAAAKMSGKQIFPLVLKDCDRSSLSEYQAVFINQADSAAREEVFERLLHDLEARGLGPKDHLPWPNSELKDANGKIDDCPYPGLPAFDERYAAVYFGRERETQAVLEELRQMRTKGEPRLLMIVGGSGSGKSSLIMAGVLPRLKHVTSRTEWFVLPTLRFGRRDYDDALFETLADDIVARYPQGATARGVRVPDRRTLRTQFAAEDSARAAQTFLDATREVAIACGLKDATALLPIDQFEEFLAPSTGSRADKFLKFLKDLCRDRNDRLLVIGTMRSDYLDVYERNPHALTNPKFSPWRLEPLPREQIENAILRPAAKVHVNVAPELVERLKQETPTTDALPLLAFTLEKLYRRRAADKELTLSEYHEMGGMEGSIRKTAEQIMAANMGLTNVESLVRVSFVKHLVEVKPKSGTDEVAFVRLTARWSDFESVAQPILEQFVAQRLLVKTEHKGEVFLEVAHEAMFRCWPQLNQWLQNSADLLKWRRELRTGRFLWGMDLAAGEKWLKKQPDELRESEKRRIHWGWGLRLSLVTALMITAATMFSLTVYFYVVKWDAQIKEQAANTSEKIAKANTRAAIKSREDAEKNAQVAQENARDAQRQTANVLWTQAFFERDNLQLPTHAGLHFLKAAQILEAAREPALVKSSLLAVRGMHDRTPISFAHDGPVSGAKLTQDATRVLTWSDDIVRLWDVTADRLLRQWKHDSGVSGASFNQEETHVLTWSYDGTARLWEVDSDRPLRQWKHDSYVNGASFNQKETHVLTWSRDRTARLWEVDSDRPLRQWTHDSDVKGASFNREETHVLTWSYDRTARLWDVNSDQPLRRWEHDNWVNGASFNREETRVLTWSEDSTARLWDVGSDQPLRQWKHGASPVKEASFIRADTQVLTWTASFTPQWWDVGSDQPLQKWKHDTSLVGALFNRQATRVLTWSSNIARLWDVDSDRPLQQWTHEGDVRGASFNREERRVLTWSANTVQLWDVGSAQPLRQWKDDDYVQGASFSREETHVLTWSGNTARLWDVAEQPVRKWTHDSPLNHALFNRDGTRVLTWSNKTAWLWDVASDQPLRKWKHDDKRDDFISGASFNLGETRVLTRSGNTARLWDVDSDQPLQQWKHDTNVADASFDRKETRVLTWSEDSTARLWDVTSDQPLRKWSNVNGASFNRGGTRVLTWSKDSTARLWDVDSDQPLQQWKHDTDVKGASFNREGTHVLTWSGNAARLWDVTVDQPLRQWNHDGDVYGASFNDEGTRVLTRSGKTAWLWNVASDQSLRQWKHDDDVYDASFNREGTRVLTRSGLGQWWLWDIASDRPLGHSGNAFSRALFNDETRVLDWSGDTARLWDVAFDQPLRQWRHDAKSDVIVVSFNREKTRLLTRNHYEVWLWDVSLDESLSLEDRVLEFEVRTATTLDDAGRPRTLKFTEWDMKRKQLDEARKRRSVKTQ